MFNAETVKSDIVRWIKNYFLQSGNECVAVIGISGGKDSSIVAALCCEALGKDRVFGVLMPSGVQPDIGVAIDLVSFLGIKYKVLNVGESVDKLLLEVNNAFNCDNLEARINTPARIRMATLYAVSAVVHGRVANTCNLSEDCVGYSTKFGDAAGDFSPLANLTVSEVKMLGTALGLPAKFTHKTPIDGLCGKSDEENLGFTYEVLDKYIRTGVCNDDIIKDKIDKLHNRGLHKLREMPTFIYNSLYNNNNNNNYCDTGEFIEEPMCGTYALMGGMRGELKGGGTLSVKQVNKVKGVNDCDGNPKTLEDCSRTVFI